MTLMAPNYDGICDRAGFPVPRDYLTLVELSFALKPEEPWNAFWALGLCYFDLTVACPEYRLDAVNYMEYSGTPAEGVVLAWTGGDGAHYVWIVDDPPPSETEVPIATVCYDGCHRFCGRTIREFLATTVATLEQPTLRELRLIDRLCESFAIDRELRVDADDVHEMIVRQRAECGAIPTEDGLGIFLPEGSYNSGVLDAIEWSWPDTNILRLAEDRLSDEPGTALVLARNFRHHFDYQDWKTERRFMPWTADILETAYLSLNRVRAARKVRAQTEWALRNLR